MGDLDGRLRHLDRRVFELRAGAGESGDSGRRLRSRLPAAPRAIDLRDYHAAKENRAGYACGREITKYRLGNPIDVRIFDEAIANQLASQPHPFNVLRFSENRS